jgi:hypothetical protein
MVKRQLTVNNQLMVDNLKLLLMEVLQLNQPMVVLKLQHTVDNHKHQHMVVVHLLNPLTVVNQQEALVKQHQELQRLQQGLLVKFL